MWSTILDFFSSAINAAFSWFGQIMDAVPGAWSTVFNLIVIMILSRFLLGPLLGALFNPSSGSSDTSKRKRPGSGGDR